MCGRSTVNIDSCNKHAIQVNEAEITTSKDDCIPIIPYGGDRQLSLINANKL